MNILKYLKVTKNNTYNDVMALFLFHSNKIEGSTFSLVEIDKLINISQVSGVHDIDDVIETKNSINLFDYIVEYYDQELTLFELRNYHALLKKDTSDEKYGFVGKFKLLSNELKNVDLKLAQPYEVEEKLNALLAQYQNKKMSINDIANFHKEFELIHPFNDGNGRIGRFIILKQCMMNNIDFILIDEKNDVEYKKALYKAQKENDLTELVKVLEKGQELFKMTLPIFVKQQEQYQLINNKSQQDK